MYIQSSLLKSQIAQGDMPMVTPIFVGGCFFCLSPLTDKNLIFVASHYMFKHICAHM